jgi:hypothetical protein
MASTTCENQATRSVFLYRSTIFSILYQQSTPGILATIHTESGMARNCYSYIVIVTQKTKSKSQSNHILYSSQVTMQYLHLITLAGHHFLSYPLIMVSYYYVLHLLISYFFFLFFQPADWGQGWIRIMGAGGWQLARHTFINYGQ